MCELGGLMEDPDFHWEIIGKAEGDTVKEVADNLTKKDINFAKYYNPKTVTYFGWRLKILSEEPQIKIVKFNAILSYQYYINNTYIRESDLIEMLAKKLNIEIIKEGNGTERVRSVKTKKELI